MEAMLSVPGFQNRAWHTMGALFTEGDAGVQLIQV